MDRSTDLKPIAQLGWRRFYTLAELELWALASGRRRLSARAAARVSCADMMNGDHQ
jgi:hypothetical protein